MARFFKFIFRVLLIVYIAVVLALIVPPLVGFTTATVQETSERNQSVGTVDYAKRIPLQDLKPGEQILVTGTNSVKVYTVQFVDTEQSVVTVADAQAQQIPVRSYVYKVVLAVPYIGYIIIALQTMEGMIVLAMIAILLILLCVLTGIWSKMVKEKKRKRKEMEAEKAAEKAAEEKRAAEEAAREEARKSAEGNHVLNARAEAYFAARRAEQNRSSVQFEEYEDFPPKSVPANEKKEAAVAKAKKAAAELEYFDEDDGETDFWLHDDVDDEDLFAGLNNKAATESLMATARLFAINRAAQLKEQMAQDEKTETADQTKVVSPQEMAAMKAQEAAAAVKAAPKAAPKPAPQPAASVEAKPVVQEKKGVVRNEPVKEFSVDKVINLKELKKLDEDTQQIVFTINIKVVSE